MTDCRAGYHVCMCQEKACELQQCVDDAFWDLLAGLHDIEEGGSSLTYEDVIKHAMKRLGKYQCGVG